jgi:hypothetical protein
MTVVEKRVAKAKIDHGMDLGSMKLREIPVAVTECSPKVLCEVKRVSFEENRLVHLPRNFFELLGGAVSMMLYKNQLCYIPTDIGRLKHLNMLILSNNNLQILPPSIGDLSSLSIFHVNGNPRLRRLPLEFGKLSHTSAGGVVPSQTISQPPEISRPLSLSFFHSVYFPSIHGFIFPSATDSALVFLSFYREAPENTNSHSVCDDDEVLSHLRASEGSAVRRGADNVSPGHHL